MKLKDGIILNLFLHLLNFSTSDAYLSLHKKNKGVINKELKERVGMYYIFP